VQGRSTGKTLAHTPAVEGVDRSSSEENEKKQRTSSLEDAALVGRKEVGHILSPDRYVLLATVVAVEDAGSPAGFSDRQRVAATE